MSRVFLSYAAADGEAAALLRTWLREQGHQVEPPADAVDAIPVGDGWERRLHASLGWADAMVCLRSPDHLDSTRCTVEIAVARSRGVRLLPVVVRPGGPHPLLPAAPVADLSADPDGAGARLVDALRRSDPVDPGWPDARSPFPGLRSFDADLHRVFFGRGHDVDRIVGLLRSAAERADATALVVVGPSGCGKSSLVRAGLVPAVRAEPGWLTLHPITPGADPVTALARELTAAGADHGTGWTVRYVLEQLDAGRLTMLADELLRAAPGRPEQLLLVVDQFEEALVRAPAEARQRFVGLLATAPAGPVRVVATLRAEFQGLLLADPAMAGLPIRMQPLRPLPREALCEVIEEPARLAGIAVDDGLVERLVADTGDGGALPLLAFTLAELAADGDRLSDSGYDRLGPVRDALARRANAALQDATAARGRSREQVVAALVGLVTVDVAGRAVGAPSVPDDDTAAELDAFVTCRLLTVDPTGAVGLAHNVLATAWEPLAAGVASAASAQRTRRAVEDAAAAWERSGRRPERLWEGGRLASAMADTGTRTRPATGGAWWRPGVLGSAVPLDGSALDFLRAGTRRDRRRRWRVTTVLSVLLVLAVAGAGVAVVRQRATEGENLQATARQLLAQADAARATDPRTALLLGIAAERIDPGDRTRSALVETLTNDFYAGTLTGSQGGVEAVGYSPDGRTLAVAGTDVLLWDVTDTDRPRRLGEPLTSALAAQGRLSSVSFSADGATLAGADSGRLVMWDVTDPARPVRYNGPDAVPVSTAVFSPDGRTLATADGGLVLLWDVTDPRKPLRRGAPFGDPATAGATMAFSPDGRTLVTTGDAPDPGAVLWDVTTPAPTPPVLAALAGRSGPFAFAPDGRTLAAGDTTGSVVLLDLTDPTRPAPTAAVLPGDVGAVAFSADGTTVATGGRGGSVQLWDATDRDFPVPIGIPLAGHTGQVAALAFTASGLLASGSGDGTVRLWDTSTLVRRRGPPAPGHPEYVDAMAFSPDGTAMTTTSGDGTVIDWDPAPAGGPIARGRPLDGRSEVAPPVVLSSDGRSLATGTSDGRTRLWELPGPGAPARAGRILAGPGYPVLVAPGGATIVTAGRPPGAGRGDDDEMALWSLDDPAAPPRRGPPWDPASMVGVISADGRTIVTADVYAADRQVRLWDAGDGDVRPGPVLGGDAEFVSAVAFSPDGAVLAVGHGDGGVVLWDVTDPTEPVRIGQPLPGRQASPDAAPGPLTSEFAVSAMAFSADSRTFAVASGVTSTVALWDLTDRQRPFRIGSGLTGSWRAVFAVALSPDGRVLATGDRAGGVTVWDLSGVADRGDRVVERACARAGGGLDPDEWARYLPDTPYEDTCAG